MPVTVRDSSGVQIVESHGESWRPGEEWHVEPEASLSIGGHDGDSDYLFAGIRAVDLLPDGGVLVLDGSSRRFMRYGSDGRLLWSAGRRGEGPGEFEQPQYLGRLPDQSFAVWDRDHVRLTVFDSDGKLQRSDSFIGGSGPDPVGYGIFADGSLLAVYPNMIGPREPGIWPQDTVSFWRVTGHDAEPQPLAHLPGPIWAWTGEFQLPVPFTANPLRALAGRNFIVASGHLPEVRVYQDTGQLIARYVLARRPVGITPSEVQSIVGLYVEHRAYGAPKEVWDEWIPRMPIPEHKPAFDRLIVADTGHIWVRRFLSPWESAAVPTWDVLDPDGAHLGPVETPIGLDVTAVGNGALVGIFRDALGVEHVRVHRYSTARGTG